MSCEQNTQFLEAKYDEGIEKGMSHTEAEKYAYKCLEEAD
jgi:hypothetical protein